MRLLVVSLLGLFFSPVEHPQPSPLSADTDGQSAKILFQSADGGNTWQDISAGLPANLRVSSILVQDGEVFLTGEKGLADENQTIYHSLQPDKGVWEQDEISNFLSNPGGLLPDAYITGLFPGRSGPFVGISEGGFFRKQASAHRWQPLRGPLPDDWIHSIVENADGTLLVAGNKGIYKSRNDGKTWEKVYTAWAMSLFLQDNTLLASGAQGLLRSTDGGDRWTCVLPDQGGTYLTLALSNRLAALRFGSIDEDAQANVPLHISDDGGQTWQQLAAGLPPSIHHLYDLVQLGDELFCSHAAGISRSTDGGKTWLSVYNLENTGKMVRIRLAVSGGNLLAFMGRGGC